jgi:hypothetical protein
VQQGNINVAAVAEIEDYIVSEHKRQWYKVRKIRKAIQFKIL